MRVYENQGMAYESNVYECGQVWVMRYLYVYAHSLAKCAYVYDYCISFCVVKSVKVAVLST